MRELGLGKHGELGNRSDTCHTSWVGGRGLYRSHLGIEMRHSINVFIQQLYLRVKSEKDKAPREATVALWYAENYNQIGNWIQEACGMLPLVELLPVFPSAPSSRAHCALG